MKDLVIYVNRFRIKLAFNNPNRKINLDVKVKSVVLRCLRKCKHNTTSAFTSKQSNFFFFFHGNLPTHAGATMLGFDSAWYLNLVWMQSLIHNSFSFSVALITRSTVCQINTFTWQRINRFTYNIYFIVITLDTLGKNTSWKRQELFVHNTHCKFSKC